ncbi:MAG: SRPBCC family protein [Acidimicrobiales bacterium]
MRRVETAPFDTAGCSLSVLSLLRSWNITMARYVTRIRTPWTPEESFAYMADLRNFARWDPGVRNVTQTMGDGGGDASVFDVTIAGVPKDIMLTYRTIEYDAPRHLLVLARSRVFTSEDRITVTPDGGGSIVEYDAQFRFNGVLGVADLASRPFFNRIADRASTGLGVEIQGTKVWSDQTGGVSSARDVSIRAAFARFAIIEPKTILSHSLRHASPRQQRVRGPCLSG